MPDAPAADLDAVLARLDDGLDAALERLFAFVRHPSVSADPAHAADCRAAAGWLARELEGIGFAARLWEDPGGGQPVLVAHGGPEGTRPHLLFYGHYDVQPPDPLEGWAHDPFEPEIHSRADGSRFATARGISDNKGQLMTFVEACRAWVAATGGLPARITLLVEGEEESGGGALRRFLDGPGAEEVRADLALVCDTEMWDAETPAITTRLRGTLTLEATVRGPERDLHSGLYGGAAANPIHELVRALAGLRDASGRITLPGFYDGVGELPPEIARQWEGLGFDARAFLGAVGLSEPAGEADRSALEQVWSRPTAEINGIWGGYTGAGFKTVIPAEAHAKVSFRLVGDQDPDAIAAAFEAHLARSVRPDCRAEVRVNGAARAIEMPVEAPAFAAARAALTEEWGREAAFIGCGGSIPVVGTFRRRLGMDAILAGFALADDRWHSPNEKYELRSFARGARSWARILAALSG